MTKTEWLYFDLPDWDMAVDWLGRLLLVGLAVVVLWAAVTA